MLRSPAGYRPAQIGAVLTGAQRGGRAPQPSRLPKAPPEHWPTRFSFRRASLRPRRPNSPRTSNVPDDNLAASLVASYFLYPQRERHRCPTLSEQPCVSAGIAVGISTREEMPPSEEGPSAATGGQVAGRARLWFPPPTKIATTLSGVVQGFTLNSREEEAWAISLSHASRTPGPWFTARSCRSAARLIHKLLQRWSRMPTAHHR